ncbi:uncharacterized protein LOC126367636 [Pectinophora gossypiella]|uniref:uncharacterized protein LOC126367636 n=1 Tax=Pectinophora gossypiella TaxID=13191 RepID=UPI00214F3C79|nr:uncharacterized protein LOC126367636 [Pectinophora gossypiella]
MKQFKVAVGVLAVTSCFVTMLLYYWHWLMMSENIHFDAGSSEELDIDNKVTHSTIRPRQYGTPMSHVPLDTIYKDAANDESLELAEERGPIYLLDTPGCRIPVSIIPYQIINKKQKHKPGTCGIRAVYLKRVEVDTVQAIIKDKLMKTYLRKGDRYECCYRFFTKYTHPGKERTKIKYTPCHKLKDLQVFTIESDFVNVKCSQKDRLKKTSHVIYDDVYPFVKMVSPNEQSGEEGKRKRFNVLMIGMDSMSLARFSAVMSRTVKFFEENYWLAYRGFHKIGDNTLPNLMATFTGLNMSAVAQKCSGKMDECRDLFIWNKFRKDGYVTAYGEDHLRLPDTFHDEYEFKKPPTDHYMRPFFMKEETEFSNQSLVCAGKAPSGQQILDYALDFAVTYRFKCFFGVFWLNSYSHNANSHPEDGDKTIENFLNRLSYTGILDDTFIIIFSDHGVRFGELRLLPQSYYDERLPGLFMWVPLLFKSRRTRMFHSAALNQYKLVTHYDLYNTLVDIHRVSLNSNSELTALVGVAEGCPRCHSLFKTINANRTCRDAAIDEKWCACHHIYPLTIEDTEAMKSVDLVVRWKKTFK